MSEVATTPLLRALHALSTVFVEEGTPEVQARIVSVALDWAGADLASLTLVEVGAPVTVAASDRLAAELDSRQYEAGIGPCIDAVTHASAHRIDDAADEHRWRPFAQACTARGIVSVAALPLLGREGPQGVLNLYGRDRAIFTGVETSSDVFTDAVGVLLANARAYSAARELGENLEQAMRSRSVIEQAKGVLMARSGMTADAAFEMLRRASQRENVKLRDLALRIVSHEQADGIA